MENAAEETDTDLPGCEPAAACSVDGELRQVRRADIPAGVRCYSFWHASTLPGVYGVIAVRERPGIDAFERLAQFLPNRRYAARDGTRLWRASSLAAAEERYTREARAKSLPAAPRFWLL